MAQIIRLLNELITAVHQAKLTRQQHIMFLLADLMTAAEAGAALVRKLSRIDKNHEAQMDHLKICGRINSAFAAQIAHLTAHQIIIGSGNWSAQDLMEIFNTSGFNFQATQAGLIADMDAIAGKL